MTVTVRVATNESDLKKWIEFPRLSVYPPSSPWVPPLDSDLHRMLDHKRNPFFRYGDARPMLAVDEHDKVLGRVLAHVYHRHNVRHGERTSFFGYFECVRDQAVADALLNVARQFGSQNGCTMLRGPFNMTAMQEMGILTSGFEHAPVVDETYTAEYYPELLEAAGLTAVFPVSTFRVDDLQSVSPESLLSDRHHKLLAEGGLKIRPVRMSEYDREIETLRELLNDSFYENPHFVPITNEEFEFQVGPYKRLFDPRIILLAEKDGVPCGFVLAVPEFNSLLKKMNGQVKPSSFVKFLKERKSLSGAAVLIMGVQRQLQGQGVMRLLFHELLTVLKKANYKTLTITWIADVNDKSLGSAKAVGGKPFHRLCLYETKIAGSQPGAE